MADEWKAPQRLPSRLLTASIAVGLASVAAVLMWAALAKPPAPGSAVTGAPIGPSRPSMSLEVRTTPERPAPRIDRAEIRDRITGLVLSESEPVTVSIPRIGARSTLVDLGLDEDGAMEVPHDPALAGWFSRGPTPGALGPAVIAGHVTWDGAPGVFHRLGHVRRGDRVTVAREDGRVAVFAVSRVAQFPKSRFPGREVYGAIDHAGLRLITCGGAYDAARHRYPDNVVVFAKLAAVRRSGGG